MYVLLNPNLNCFFKFIKPGSKKISFGVRVSEVIHLVRLSVAFAKVSGHVIPYSVGYSFNMQIKEVPTFVWLST
jgi:hypothetical protein